MDSITQGALGALCGEITLRKQIGCKGVAWGIFFGTLPDLDILAYPFLTNVEELSWHRGISHSILMMILASFFFGWLLEKIHRKKGVTFKQASWFVFITWFTHVLIDCFTTYGTQVFEPFSSYRVAFNNMSIIDVSFTLPMLIGVIAVLFFKRDSSKRTKLGRGIAIWLCVYTCASFGMKSWATHTFKQRLAEQGIEPTRIMTSPTISNIFLWRMLAESNDSSNGKQLHISYWSPFDSSDTQTQIRSISKGTEHLTRFAELDETKKLRWFSGGWYKAIPVDDGSVIFIDMRFGELCTEDSNIPMFAWSIYDTPEKMRRVSFTKKIDTKATLGFLTQRVIGNSPTWFTHPWPWEKQQVFILPE